MARLAMTYKRSLAANWQACQPVPCFFVWGTSFFVPDKQERVRKESKRPSGAWVKLLIIALDSIFHNYTFMD